MGKKLQNAQIPGEFHEFWEIYFFGTPLPYAEALAQKFDAELILVLVLQTPAAPIVVEPHVGFPFYGHDETIMAEERKEALDYLGNLQDNLRKQNISTRIEVLEKASVADGIVDIASQEEIDVIVKTTHGRSGPSRWVYGSVATKVLQHAPCPVFLVRVK